MLSSSKLLNHNNNGNARRNENSFDETEHNKVNKTQSTVFVSLIYRKCELIRLSKQSKHTISNKEERGDIQSNISDDKTTRYFKIWESSLIGNHDNNAKEKSIDYYASNNNTSVPNPQVRLNCINDNKQQERNILFISLIDVDRVLILSFKLSDHFNDNNNDNDSASLYHPQVSSKRGDKFVSNHINATSIVHDTNSNINKINDNNDGASELIIPPKSNARSFENSINETQQEEEKEEIERINEERINNYIIQERLNRHAQHNKTNSVSTVAGNRSDNKNSSDDDKQRREERNFISVSLIDWECVLISLLSKLVNHINNNGNDRNGNTAFLILSSNLSSNFSIRENHSKDNQTHEDKNIIDISNNGVYRTDDDSIILILLSDLLNREEERDNENIIDNVLNRKENWKCITYVLILLS